MKNYLRVQSGKSVGTPKPLVKSGVACTETHCEGEMYFLKPKVQHPEYTRLRRAMCNKCGWRGWI